MNVPPWKGGIRKFRIEGSNPSPSAKIQKGRKLRLPAFFHACGVPAHPACRLQFFFKRFLTFSKNSGILRLLSKFDVSTKPITTAGMFAEHLWKGGRVVECTALERRHTEIPYRGFESLPFRQNTDPEASQAPGFSLFTLSTKHIPEFYFRRFRQNPPDCDILRHAIDCGGGSFGGSFFGGSLVGLTRFTAQR